MTIPHVALVSETTAVSLADLVQVAAAIQKQVSRDLQPLWNIQATVDAFDSVNHVPLDYWHVIIRDDIDALGQSGFHKTEMHQPFALVQFDDDWSITTSHEVLEMLADPSGNWFVAGDSVKTGQGRVNYLVEICDPVQQSIYTINDVRVCDFFTPQYFDPAFTSGARYSFSGNLKSPRGLLKGGYLAFFDPVSRHWFQQQWFDTIKPEIIDLGLDTVGPTGALRHPKESLREMIDRCNRPRSRTAQPRRRRPRKGSHSTATLANADLLRENIARLVSGE